MKYVGKGWFLNVGLLNQFMFGIEWDLDFWYVAVNLGPIRIFVSDSDPLAMWISFIEDNKDDHE